MTYFRKVHGKAPRFVKEYVLLKWYQTHIDEVHGGVAPESASHDFEGKPRTALNTTASNN